eukprot:g136.t1
MSSTQSAVQKLLPDIPSGFCCVADTQTKGRGRGGNSWESPPGCLLFTFVSRFPVSTCRDIPFVQYLVSLAVVESIRSIEGCEKLDLNLKWPNDIYAKRKLKVGGVLCQSSIFRGTFEVVVGVGLNVNNDAPSTCLNSLLKEAGSERRVTRGEILGRFCALYDQMESEFLESGFAPFLEKYYAAWLHDGQVVRASIPRVTSSGEGADDDTNLCTMTVRGLCESGALKAVDSEGNVHELFPDGNRFDFMRGLVSQKTYPKDEAP